MSANAGQYASDEALARRLQEQEYAAAGFEASTGVPLPFAPMGPSTPPSPPALPPHYQASRGMPYGFPGMFEDAVRIHNDEPFNGMSAMDPSPFGRPETMRWGPGHNNPAHLQYPSQAPYGYPYPSPSHHPYSAAASAAAAAAAAAERRQQQYRRSHPVSSNNFPRRGDSPAARHSPSSSMDGSDRTAGLQDVRHDRVQRYSSEHENNRRTSGRSRSSRNPRHRDSNASGEFGYGLGRGVPQQHPGSRSQGSHESFFGQVYGGDPVGLSGNGAGGRDGGSRSGGAVMGPGGAFFTFGHFGDSGSSPGINHGDIPFPPDRPGDIFQFVENFMSALAPGGPRPGSQGQREIDPASANNPFRNAPFGPLFAQVANAFGNGPFGFGSDENRTYEDWIQLIERMGVAENRGATDDEIASLPVEKVKHQSSSNTKNLRGKQAPNPGASSSTVPSGADEEEKCAICLGSYEEGDEIKRLPCMHKFCNDCISRWLKISKECPCCKASIRGD